MKLDDIEEGMIEASKINQLVKEDKATCILNIKIGDYNNPIQRHRPCYYIYQLDNGKYIEVKLTYYINHMKVLPESTTIDEERVYNKLGDEIREHIRERGSKGLNILTDEIGLNLEEYEI